MSLQISNAIFYNNSVTSLIQYSPIGTNVFSNVKFELNSNVNSMVYLANDNANPYDLTPQIFFINSIFKDNGLLCVLCVVCVLCFDL